MRCGPEPSTVRRLIGFRQARWEFSPRETGVGVKVAELIRMSEQDGWRVVRTKGSHRQFKNSQKPGTVTVAGKPSMDVPPGTLNAILKQAGLKKGADE